MADQIIQATEEMVGAGHATKADTLNRAFLIEHNTDGTHEKLSVGSDANGDMYYRANSVLARLAKGTANYKMFMNAGGTAPEWAMGIKTISSSYDLSTESGDQSITGVGFRPCAYIFLGTISADVVWNIGFYALAAYSIQFRGDTSKMLSGPGYISRIYLSSGSVNTVPKSIESDGITITHTKSGSPTGTLVQYWMFFR
ncbi:MAG TPA: hypothetical protein PLT63_03545 [Syntrophales bacterium]|nr:hypothetical protein [Syntrophales bacterium]